MSSNIFDGFDHTQYRDEVEQRWGAAAYATSDRWWRELGAEGQKAWRAKLAELNHDWVAAFESGEDPASPKSQQLAQRHVEWLQGVPHTPASNADYVLGLADLYVADERFARNYGGAEGAKYVRATLRNYVENG